MHIMRIYETHAHMCIVCECTHTYNTHNGIRHNAQQRTCVSAHYAHLRIACAEYVSSHHISRMRTCALNMHHLRICANAHHLRSCTCAYNMRMYFATRTSPILGRIVIMGRFLQGS